MKSSTINTYPAVLHVRFGGKSFDVPLACLDVNPATDDQLIKRALAAHLEIPESQLREYVLDRHPNGNLTLQKYREALKADPAVCIVRTPGAGDGLEKQCRNAGISVDVFQFSGDYYSLPNLVPLLSKPSRLELLMEIMEYPLPVRKSA